MLKVFREDQEIVEVKGDNRGKKGKQADTGNCIENFWSLINGAVIASVENPDNNHNQQQIADPKTDMKKNNYWLFHEISILSFNVSKLKGIKGFRKCIIQKGGICLQDRDCSRLNSGDSGLFIIIFQ